MGKSKLNYKFAIRDSQGDRPYQEDYGRALKVQLGNGDDASGGVLAVLCDGMGGHVSGEVASRSAADAYLKAFGSVGGTIEQRLDRSLDASNKALTDAISDNPDLKGMGCTLVAAFVDPSGLRWVSVGDSALLLYRNGSLHRLNEDHSFGALLDKQAEAKVISKSEAENSPRRRTLRSALTGGEVALREVRGEPVKLKSGDWIVVASDGLETLNGNEIASIIRKADSNGPDRLAEHLVKAVLDRKSPNQDNITLIPINVSDPDDLHIQPTQWVQRDENGEPSGDGEATPGKNAKGSSFVAALGLTLAVMLALMVSVAGYLWHQGVLEIPGASEFVGGSTKPDPDVETTTTGSEAGKSSAEASKSGGANGSDPNASEQASDKPKSTAKSAPDTKATDGDTASEAASDPVKDVAGSESSSEPDGTQVKKKVETGEPQARDDATKTSTPDETPDAAAPGTGNDGQSTGEDSAKPSAAN
ncbi:MAG: protein phosphatase 2C domain-containing protein [Pseudomonadota bacterium]